jgi:carboxyl-terminal processing protease
MWITSTAILCVLFTLALIPGASAQGNNDLAPQGNNLTPQMRRYSQTMQNVFDFIQRHYVDEIDPKIIFEGAMNGMLGALDDPYSVFLPESDMKDLNDTTQGSFGGVGLYINKQPERPDGKPSYVEVASPIEDTPGWRAGINPGDLIIEIDGEPTEKLTSDEVLARLRGTPGLDVKLLIRRGDKLEFPVTLTRAVIEVPTAKYAMIGDTGYLKLLTFTPMTIDRARDALKEFKTKNYKSLILDLRNNYGGLLNSAVDISSLFLDGGIVVSTKSRILSENREYNVRRALFTVPLETPVIILINRGSASASEIVAGALKDRGRAYLVGEKSYGKGSVQQVYPLDNSGFKITTARYYTPSGVNIDKTGIPPDREVQFPEYTEADAEKLNELIKDNKISEFAEKNPNANNTQIETFARSLESSYQLNFSLLKRLIRNELNRTSIAPVYDLEYDVQLQEAVNIIKSGAYFNLMRNSKTLKALQEETELEYALAS